MSTLTCDRANAARSQFSSSALIVIAHGFILHVALHVKPELRVHKRSHRTSPLPEYEEVPLNDIAHGVSGLRIFFVNALAVIGRNAGWVLIDAGLPFSAARIRKWAHDRFGDQVRPLSILLTHGHFDHTDALRELADEWDVPIYAHPKEAPFLTGMSRYPPPDPTVGGGVKALMAPLYPRGPIDVNNRLRMPDADGTIPDPPE